MQSNHAAVLIDHRIAYVIHLDRESEKIMAINSPYGNEHSITKLI